MQITLEIRLGTLLRIGLYDHRLEAVAVGPSKHITGIPGNDLGTPKT